jgi:hypothetical protein
LTLHPISDMVQPSIDIATFPRHKSSGERGLPWVVAAVVVVAEAASPLS